MYRRWSAMGSTITVGPTATRRGPIRTSGSRVMRQKSATDAGVSMTDEVHPLGEAGRRGAPACVEDPIHRLGRAPGRWSNRRTMRLAPNDRLELHGPDPSRRGASSDARDAKVRTTRSSMPIAADFDDPSTEDREGDEPTASITDVARERRHRRHEQGAGLGVDVGSRKPAGEGPLTRGRRAIGTTPATTPIAAPGATG